MLKGLKSSSIHTWNEAAAIAKHRIRWDGQAHVFDTTCLQAICKLSYSKITSGGFSVCNKNNKHFQPFHSSGLDGLAELTPSSQGALISSLITKFYHHKNKENEAFLITPIDPCSARHSHVQKCKA